MRSARCAFEHASLWACHPERNAVRHGVEGSREVFDEYIE